MRLVYVIAWARGQWRINFTCIFKLLPKFEFLGKNLKIARARGHLKFLVHKNLGQNFKGIAFALDVREMKPFQCRHKCENKRN